jgi:hypothetical protein
MQTARSPLLETGRICHGRMIRSGSADKVAYHRESQCNQEDEEQNLSDACGRACDTTKTKDASDKRDDKKDKCPIQHDNLQ